MEQREAVLDRLARETFDLLVVGGGITGAGVALDAASRGMRTALVERADFASGTSSRSTKLVHGGVRYLAQRDIALVREALAERHLLLRLAPHLVHPQPFVLPVYRGQHVPGVWAPSAATRMITAAGLSTYDLLAGRRGMQRRRNLSALGVRGLAPSLRTQDLRGGFLYYDARTDDVRLTLAVLDEAVARGAAVANYTEVVAFERREGRLVGAHVRDRIRDATVNVRAARVVNATGAWSPYVTALDAPEARSTGGLRLSKGVHLVIDRRSLPIGPVAVVLPVTADGRLAFVVPWGTQVLLGTTDTPYDGEPGAVSPNVHDVDALLADANRFLNMGLTRGDVISAFAGLRPLVETDAASTATTSREHAVTVAPSGLVTVSGGKLTTYRRMAIDTVDAALEAAPGPWGRSRTGRIYLRGGVGLADGAAVAYASGRAAGLPVHVLTHLIASYGSRAPDLVALIAADSSLGATLTPALPYVGAEVVYAARYEGATTLDDVLRRRTRVTLEERDAGSAAAPRVAALLGDELGWDAVTRQQEVVRYRGEVQNARAAWSDSPEYLGAP